jgi:hypothetical protein
MVVTFDVLPCLTSFAKYGVAIVVRKVTDALDCIRLVLLKWLWQRRRGGGGEGRAVDRAGDRIGKRRGMLSGIELSVII